MPESARQRRPKANGDAPGNNAELMSLSIRPDWA
jgi:hypothetical protein